MQELCSVWVFCRGWNVPAWAEVAEKMIEAPSKAKPGPRGVSSRVSIWSNANREQSHKVQDPVPVPRQRKQLKEAGESWADEQHGFQPGPWESCVSRGDTTHHLQANFIPPAQKSREIHEKGGKYHWSSQRKARTHKRKVYRVTMTRSFWDEKGIRATSCQLRNTLLTFTHTSNIQTNGALHTFCK